jgi:phosphohistidine swiveling domain-containing protein
MKKSIKEKLLKRRWYIQGINAVPAFVHSGDVSGIKYMPKNFGFGYTNFLYIFKKDYVEYHYDRDSLEFLADKIMKRYFKDNSYLNRLLKMTEEDREPFYQYLKKNILSKDDYSSKLDDQELVREYKKFFQLFCQVFSTSHLIEPLALTTDTRLRDLILRELTKKGLEKNFSQYFNILTQPISESFINNYNQDLKRVHYLINKDHRLKLSFKNKTVSQIKEALSDDLKIDKAIQEHLAKYFWINSNWRGGKDYTLANLIKLLRRIIKKEDKLRVYPEKKFRSNFLVKNSLIKKLRLSQEIIKLIRLTDVVTKWQDERKKDIIVGAWALNKFVLELAKRFKIDHQDLRYLLPEKVTLNLLKNPKLKEQLSAMRNYSVYLFYKNETEILTGKEAKRFVKRLKGRKESFTKEINGLAASLGKISGITRICLTIEDLKKVKKDEILVTTMTRPEFVPAMKKAAAVVTDEGGLTCHAAIVSRELGIPCVIGTKMATRVLKDGDLVEVNANHGMVKKINK